MEGTDFEIKYKKKKIVVILFELTIAKAPKKIKTLCGLSFTLQLIQIIFPEYLHPLEVQYSLNINDHRNT